MRLVLSLLSSLTIAQFGWSAVCVADQHAPIAVRVLNLSSQPISAFFITGLPFRTVGLDVRPGEPLTPAFGDGQMEYELYWRFRDGTVHGATVDFRTELPSPFYGDAIISIHEEYVKVSWSNMNAAWIHYSHVGDPKKVPRPSVPYYSGCAGAVLQNPLTVNAWKKAADSVRERTADAGAAEIKIEDNRCNLDWYIPRAAERERSSLDEDTVVRLRKEWLAEVEAYRARGLNPRLAK